MLKGKTVLLGVTGGIAAYKAAALASALVKQHAAVEVVMTENATKFVTPLTFEQLTGRRTMVDTFDRDFKFEVTHISLAKKADLILVAPATANVIAKLAHEKDLAGLRGTVTAGPTQESLDPVRYLTNHSTGKMGYAIADALAKRGAEVVLVSGKSALATPQGVRRVDVGSAEEMYEASIKEFEKVDCAVMCAAVADYTPVEVSASKIKKSDESFTIELRKTKDIARELGKVKGSRKIVGFALETDNEQSNAEHKLQSKNLDMIVLNSLRDEGAGFGHDTNKVSFIDATHREELPLLSKVEVAERIADKIEQLLK